MAEAPRNGSDHISTEPAPGYIVSRTAPDELLRHDISDEELGVFVDMRREHLWEAMWVALGVALGIFPACVGAVYAAFFAEVVVDGVTEQQTPLDMIDLAQIIIFAGSAASFGILCWVMRGKGRTAKDLAAAIRERTKHHVPR